MLIRTFLISRSGSGFLNWRDPYPTFQIDHIRIRLKTAYYIKLNFSLLLPSFQQAMTTFPNEEEVAIFKREIFLQKLSQKALLNRWVKYIKIYYKMKKYTKLVLETRKRKRLFQWNGSGDRNSKVSLNVVVTHCL